MARRKLDVKDAAQVLGISTDAVHKRARRGSLQSEKDDDGRVFVWLDADDSSYTDSSHNVQPLIVERLENENEFLRQELERRSGELAEMRRLLAGALERIPELQAPPDTPSPEPPESPVTASEEPSSTQEAPQEEERRSWWQRLFGG